MTGHADLPTLLAYWQGDLDDAEEAAFEQHYLGCETCRARLAEVEAIAAGVRRAFVAGRLGAYITPAFAERLRSSGLRIREYRVPRNGSVNCTIAPDDDVLMSRLQVPLEGVERIDAISIDQGEQRVEDIPFDRSAGEVVWAPSVAYVKKMPECRSSVRLVAVGPGGDRVLGDYVFNHKP